MESLWKKTKKRELSQYPPLNEDIHVEAAVIGGGMAGILTAWFLQKKGIKVIVIEADEIGCGQTKGTTAKITSQHGLIYHKLIKDIGEERAKQYAMANERAIEDYRTLIEKKKISCEFEMLPAYLYAEDETEELIKEAEAAKHLGILAQHQTGPIPSFPIPVSSSVCFFNQAQFHPLKFLYTIAEELPIYEHTKVLHVEEQTIQTEQGKVFAEHIIFATHYPFLNVPGYYFMRMHQERSYVIALANAGVTKIKRGMYYGVNGDKLSVRMTEEFLLLGGGGHRTGENKVGGKYQFLQSKASQYWPESEIVTCWSAQDCMTLDHVPYIGCYSSSTPNWYVATGFKKWGMTSSMVAARIICDKILGIENETAEVFQPQRFTSASIPMFFADGIHSAKDLSKRVWKKPDMELKELPEEHGGVVEYDGKKYGVYKNKEGEMFFVSIKCPHLGCQLEWNPDEKSWDCPCHGSRFDYKGNLIDNPAQEELFHE